MASSPLSMFRRYQFAFLVGFGCLLMFSFIIAPPLQEYLRSRANEGGNPVVVSYSGGKVRLADLTRLRANHARSHEVLRKLFMETQRKGGFPKAQELPRYSADIDLLEVVFLAAKARKMGMQVTDDAINEFLADWTDQTVGGDDIVQAIRDADLSQAGFFEQLRTEMLARNLRILANGGSIVVTPAALWNNFNRINRKMTAEVLPIRVADFVGKVSGEPGEAELKALFDEYKDRLPNPNFAEPGFALPYRAAFSYVTADYEQFLTKAKSQITEVEIEAEYQRRVEQGQYRRLAPLPDQPSPTDRPPAPAAATPVIPPSGVDAPPAQDPAKDPGKEGEPSQNESATDSGAPANDEAAGEAPAQPPNSETSGKGKEEPPAQGDGDQQALFGGVDRVFFTSLQDSKQEDAPKAEPSPPATEAPQQEAAQPAASPATPAPTLEAPADTTSAGAAQDSAPPSSPPPAGSGPPGADKAADEREVIPLSEVREQVLDSLASAKAVTLMDEAINAAYDEVNAYFRKRTRDERNSGEGEEKGAKKDATESEGVKQEIDVEALATKHGLIAGRIPLGDIFAMQETELGKVTEFDSNSMSIREVFFERGFLPEIPLYRPGRMGGQLSNQKYVFWKTAEREQREAEFAEVKDRVELAWKMQKARDLAEADARKLLERAKGDESFKASLGAEGDAAIETNEFSWFTRGMMPFGGSNQLSLGTVEGVERPGEGFMKTVFELAPGGVGMAFNNPKDTIYLIRLVNENSVDVRREQFLRTGQFASQQEFAQVDYQNAYRKWIDEIKKELGVTFVSTDLLQDRF